MSDQYKPSVVVSPNKSTNRFALSLSFFACLLLGVLIGGLVTYFVWLPKQQQQLVNDSDMVYNVIASDKASNNTIVAKQQEELLKLEAENDLNKQTIKSLQGLIATEAKSKTQLQQDLQFYKGLMKVDSAKKGISVGRWVVKLVGSDEAHNLYRYELVIQQRAIRHALVSGTVTIALLGQEKNEEKAYFLKSLSRQLSDDEVVTKEQQALKLRFKYFQTLEGEFKVPKSLHLESVLVSMVLTKPKKLTIDERYDWTLASNSQNIR